MEFSHVSVLLEESVNALRPERGGIFVDCTAGMGGHSERLLGVLPEGSLLISLDRDDAAIERCTQRLAKYGEKSKIVKSNYSEINAVLDSLGIEKINGVLYDLGVSSVQLDDASRGFSYMNDAPLDMRMNRAEGKTAADVVNTYSERDLFRIIKDYGEENFASRIARRIVEERENGRIETTFRFSEIITSAIPAAARKKEKQHPAKRTFQAIRIEVNDELSAIEPSIRSAVSRLEKGGRVSVISFQSLEDRIVKQTFKSLENPCTCPPDFPVCVCGKKPEVKVLSKKPVLPTEEETETNPRSRSAKLRVCEKL